jgi:hypothetical protein
VVRPVFTAISEQGEQDPSEGLSLLELANRTGSSPAAASVALDHLNDNLFAVNRFKVCDGKVVRDAFAAEVGGTWEDYPERYGGGRIATRPTLWEIPDKVSGESTADWAKRLYHT